MSYHGLGLSIGPTLPGGLTPGQIASQPAPQGANPDTGSFMSFAPMPVAMPGVRPGIVAGTYVPRAPLPGPAPSPGPTLTPDQMAPPADTTPDFTQQMSPPVTTSSFPWKTVGMVGAGVVVLGLGGWMFFRKKSSVAQNRRRRSRR